MFWKFGGIWALIQATDLDEIITQEAKEEVGKKSLRLHTEEVQSVITGQEEKEEP